MLKARITDSTVRRLVCGLALVSCCAIPLRQSSGFAFTAIDANGLPLPDQTTGTPVTWPTVFGLVFKLVSVGFGDFAPGFVPTNGSQSWEANAMEALEEWKQLQTVGLEGIPDVGDSCARDGEVTSAWASDNCGVAFGDTVALTRITYGFPASTVQIHDADVLVNSNLKWDAYDGALRVDGNGDTIHDFRRVVLHEYGHVLGLGHPDVAGQSVVAVMNSTFLPGSDTDRLTADDKNGVIALYPDTGPLDLPCPIGNPGAIVSNCNSGGGSSSSTGGGSSAFDAALLAVILLVFGLRRFGFKLIGVLLIATPTVCAAIPTLDVLDVGDGRWTVTGTVSTDDQSVRIAIIEDVDSGSAVLIRQGSRIFDGVRVEDVQRDFVTLLVDGRRVRLPVGSGSGLSGAGRLAALPVIALERMSSSRFGVSYDDFRAMLGAVSMYSSGNELGRVGSSSDDSLLQIKAVRPSGVLDRLGLEAGDVVIAMQGEAIDGLAGAETVLNAVRPGTTLLVVYRRAESVRQLSIEVRR